MKGVCEIILLAALIAITSGLPSGEPNAGESVDAPAVFADLIAQAQAGIENLRKDIQEKLNLPDQDTVVNTIKTQSTNLVENVQNYIKQVSEDVKAKSPELEQTWNGVKEKLTKVVDDINAQIPNAKEQASQLQAKLTNGLDILVVESNKAAQAIGQNSEKIREDFAKITKQAVDIAVQTTRNLDNQLRELAVTDAPK
ncbi:hypothetical protein PV325_013329 [Microctonus aethiopoides]|uniref:Apolipophorin-III n=1 Tax=Microctonus aethiopoides TaxID=144406 RepID=A0AA39FW98_9HYME|nr:hypothetical protein PV325_013329 [Microctonus aethiopoides]KAK0093399.1 hypothetical protein PV326_013589 [Microctonus aethiopoides]KAK0176833.1 hypothetical protein PV328_000935 [Microctonus aethiopoides]